MEVELLSLGCLPPHRTHFGFGFCGYRRYRSSSFLWRSTTGGGRPSWTRKDSDSVTTTQADDDDPTMAGIASATASPGSWTYERVRAVARRDASVLRTHRSAHVRVHELKKPLPLREACEVPLALKRFQAGWLMPPLASRCGGAIGICRHLGRVVLWLSTRLPPECSRVWET